MAKKIVAWFGHGTQEAYKAANPFSFVAKNKNGTREYRFDNKKECDEMATLCKAQGCTITGTSA